eukprot:PLAT3495.1.p1 GENE.PLAT3495.1~~PLAT3495.1.p1  ORF type:complete len:151 (+),score=39.93 PLAT3495.1:322-774(+)
MEDELPRRQDERHEPLTDCSICLCPFEHGDDIVLLPCPHYFHNHCLRPWFKDNHHCPVCRFDLWEGKPASEVKDEEEEDDEDEGEDDEEEEEKAAARSRADSADEDEAGGSADGVLGGGRRGRRDAAGGDDEDEGKEDDSAYSDGVHDKK